MEQAAAGMAGILLREFPGGARCRVYYGKGNNGGDALAVGRILKARGWDVHTEGAYAESDLGDLCARKRAEFDSVTGCPAPGVGRHEVLLDGLLGIGGSSAPREPLAGKIREMNDRRARGAFTVAVDVPSGLNSDTGEAVGDCVVADLTLAVGHVKRGLVCDPAADFAGSIEVVPLPLPAIDSTGDEHVVLRDHLRQWLPRRPLNMHKGQAGRVSIVAGSPGFAGAARICSAAAVHAGAGLVTLFAREAVFDTLAASCIPEVMIRRTRDLREVLEFPADVVAIGPGLGLERPEEVLQIIRDASQRMVIDADALTILSRSPFVVRNCTTPRLLTPHPGEAERLLPQGHLSRVEWARRISALGPSLTTLLKGPRTVITDPVNTYYNSTGTPGMASGGMGDALTGVISALAAGFPDHGLALCAAAGAWLCGRSAERMVRLSGEESLSAMEVVNNIGSAFSDFRRSLENPV